MDYQLSTGQANKLDFIAVGDDILEVIGSNAGGIKNRKKMLLLYSGEKSISLTNCQNRKFRN